MSLSHKALMAHAMINADFPGNNMNTKLISLYRHSYLYKSLFHGHLSLIAPD